jgi:ribosomal protein S18 acetylase RimI-like enzyme
MVTIEDDSRPFLIREIEASAPANMIRLAQQLLLEYGRFVVAQPGAARFCFGALENEAAGLPHSFLEQGGGCIVGSVKDKPAGFIAWREMTFATTFDVIPSNAWELKRLWVRPAARGLGLGRALTQAVLDRAIAAGREAVFLDTAPASMAAAHRIYLDLGFLPCEAYNDNPVEGLAYLKKTL